ncbi:MAG: hypothetical protein KF773_16010 [Deltaproteobacteria bacterium]|nr:hypothetical protein [Deltaproteobacteria bacterium]
MSREACIELATRFGVDPEDVLEWWLERASVREYDGGQARADAEAAALEDARVELDPRVGATVIAEGLAEAPRKGPRSAPSSGAGAQIELPFGKRG